MAYRPRIYNGSLRESIECHPGNRVGVVIERHVPTALTLIIILIIYNLRLKVLAASDSADNSGRVHEWVWLSPSNGSLPLHVHLPEARGSVGVWEGSGSAVRVGYCLGHIIYFPCRGVKGHRNVAAFWNAQPFSGAVDRCRMVRAYGVQAGVTDAMVVKIGLPISFGNCVTLLRFGLLGLCPPYPGYRHEQCHDIH